MKKLAFSNFVFIMKIVIREILIAIGIIKRNKEQGLDEVFRHEDV